MGSPHTLHHSLLRPCVLHILRAAGYHSTRPSVLDTLTDITGRYMAILAQTTIKFASLDQAEPELALEITIQNVRMAMQDCGTLGPKALPVEEGFSGVEDTRGVDEFISWAMGPKAQEIRRIALEANDENYLTVLKKKQFTTSDEESKYAGTVLGKEAELRAVNIEGGEITNLKELRESLWQTRVNAATFNSLPQQSSVLKSIEDVPMESLEY